MSRRNSARVLGGSGSPAPVRSSSSFSAALRSFGLKPRMPSRANASFHPIDEAAAGVDPALALAGGAFGVFLRQRRDRRHAAMVGLAAQPAQERAHQQLRVEPIRLGATMISLYRDARGMNDIGLDVVLAEQPREPEPVAPRLESDADPPHHASD